MAVEIVRTRENLKIELIEYFECSCIYEDPIDSRILAALGEPDCAISMKDGINEYKVHSWVLASWPYFRDVAETKPKHIELEWEGGKSLFPLVDLLRFLYTGTFYDVSTAWFARRYGHVLGMKDGNGEFYPFFKSFSPVVTEDDFIFGPTELALAAI